MVNEQQTLRDLLTDQARRFEKKIFLEYGGEHYSFAAVDDRTDRVATGLSRLGLRSGDRVALLLENRPEYVFFLLGAPKLGIIPVPMDPGWNREEILAALGHSCPAAVVADSRFAALRSLVPGIRHWIMVGEESFSGESLQALTGGSVLGFWPDLDPEAPAVLLHTRGTSGSRKAVVLTHRNLLSNCHQVLQPFRIDATDRFLCALPLSSAPALVLLLLVPMAAGGTCLLRGASPAGIARDIQESRATVLAGMPGLFDGIARSPEFGSSDLSSLRLAICSSGPVGEETFREFEERHDALIVEGYGLVEATCLTCANPYTGVLKHGSLGLPLPGQVCRIVDDQGGELPAGERGEILIRGSNVMQGYYKDTEASAKALHGGWLRTGDRGYVDGDGYYYLSGRSQRP